MDSEVGAPQPSEAIPDDAILYMRIHKGWWSERKQRFGADTFSDSGEGDQTGMSTNWEKYATAEQTREQAASPAEDNYVVAMRMRDVLGIPGLSVKHRPLQNLPGHTDVIGEKTLEVKDALRRVCWIVLKPDES